MWPELGRGLRVPRRCSLFHLKCLERLDVEMEAKLTPCPRELCRHVGPGLAVHGLALLACGRLYRVLPDPAAIFALVDRSLAVAALSCHVMPPFGQGPVRCTTVAAKRPRRSGRGRRFRLQTGYFSKRAWKDSNLRHRV